jgi:hypothetical protein
MLALLVQLYLDTNNTKTIWITCWAVALLICVFTLGITSVSVLLIIPPLYLFLKHHPIPALILALLPWCCLVISIALAFHYGPSYGTTTFESRFSIPALVYQKHGLSLFGQDYGYVSFTKAWRTGVQPLSIDNVFMHIVLCEGVLIALSVLLFLSHYYYKIGEMGKPLLVSSTIGLCILGLMEYVTLDASFNFLLLYYFHQFTPLSKRIQKSLVLIISLLGLMVFILS